MDLEGRKSNIYFDKKGSQIKEGDLLKVLHFRTKSKIYYVYHTVVIEETKYFPVMAGQEYYSEKPHYRFYVVCNNEKRIYNNAEIIYQRDWSEKRLKIKP